MTYTDELVQQIREKKERQRQAKLLDRKLAVQANQDFNQFYKFSHDDIPVVKETSPQKNKVDSTP